MGVGCSQHTSKTLKVKYSGRWNAFQVAYALSKENSAASCLFCEMIRYLGVCLMPSFSIWEKTCALVPRYRRNFLPKGKGNKKKVKDGFSGGLHNLYSLSGQMQMEAWDVWRAAFPIRTRTDHVISPHDHVWLILPWAKVGSLSASMTDEMYPFPVLRRFRSTSRVW